MQVIDDSVRQQAQQQAQQTAQKLQEIEKVRKNMSQQIRNVRNRNDLLELKKQAVELNEVEKVVREEKKYLDYLSSLPTRQEAESFRAEQVKKLLKESQGAVDNRIPASQLSPKARKLVKRFKKEGYYVPATPPSPKYASVTIPKGGFSKPSQVLRSTDMLSPSKNVSFMNFKFTSNKPRTRRAGFSLW